MGRPCDVGNHVLRAGRVLYVGGEHYPSAGPREPPSELSRNARLAHAPLSGQQHMIAVSNALLQDAEFGVSVEKSEPLTQRPVDEVIVPVSCSNDT
jgi:hypothetical protein